MGGGGGLGSLMGLIRLLLYDRPMSMVRFLAEMGAAMILIALASGYFAAKTLISFQQWPAPVNVMRRRGTSRHRAGYEPRVAHAHHERDRIRQRRALRRALGCGLGRPCSRPLIARDRRGCLGRENPRSP